MTRENSINAGCVGSASDQFSLFFYKLHLNYSTCSHFVRNPATFFGHFELTTLNIYFFLGGGIYIR